MVNQIDRAAAHYGREADKALIMRLTKEREDLLIALRYAMRSMERKRAVRLEATNGVTGIHDAAIDLAKRAISACEADPQPIPVPEVMDSDFAAFDAAARALS